MKRIIITAILLLASLGMAQEPIDGLFDRLFVGSRTPVLSDKQCWKQTANLDIPIDEVLEQVKNILQGQGFEEKLTTENEIEGRKVHLATWTNGKCQVILVCKELYLSKTFFAWGSVSNGQ